MEQKTSHSWKPIVYIGVTIGSVGVVLGTLLLLAWMVHPKFSLVKENARLTAVLLGLAAYGTVVAVTRLLKKHYGREFGSYLDDADAVEAGPAPDREKLCARCGTLFGVFRNDFHEAGFCSRACREAFHKR